MFFNRPKKLTRIYLDYAAATPVSEKVLQAMQPYFREHFGNPSAIHAEGQRAKDAIETARQHVARTLGVRPAGVTWTASGTEANNLALFGYVRHLVAVEGRSYTDLEIISTAIEHPSVLEVLKALERKGVTVHYAPVTEEGKIDQAAFAELLSNKTSLVSFAYVNSEIGTVEDVRKLVRIVQKFNTVHSTAITVHVDAAQAPLWLPCQLEKLGVDMLTLDAGKCYGPKGVGVLVRTHGVHLKGVTLGGGQELGLRAGTENTPLIVGAAEAIVEAQSTYKERAAKVSILRDYLIDTLCKRIKGAVLNGSREHRIANNVNISIPGIDSEYAVVALDVAGIACSTRSACGSNKTETVPDGGAEGALRTTGSQVVRSITGDDARATSTIRFSLGEHTTKRELNTVVKALQDHLRIAK